MPTISQTGVSIAAISAVVAILGHFGIIVSADQIGQTLTDLVKVIADVGVIYGIIHQYFVTRNANVAGLAKGVFKK